MVAMAEHFAPLLRQGGEHDESDGWQLCGKICSLSQIGKGKHAGSNHRYNTYAVRTRISVRGFSGASDRESRQI
jgi:hypothetical protein